MKIGEFRRALDNFVADEEVVQLEDEAWWERLSDLLDEVYAERAFERRAQREATRCPARYQGVAQCVRSKHVTGDHYSPVTGRWKNEVTV